MARSNEEIPCAFQLLHFRRHTNGFFALNKRRRDGYATFPQLSCSVITFTAGIGENDDDVRRELAEALAPFGVKIDVEANKGRIKEPRIVSAPDSTVTLIVYPTNEELAIARQALTFA